MFLTVIRLGVIRRGEEEAAEAEAEAEAEAKEEED